MQKSEFTPIYQNYTYFQMVFLLTGSDNQFHMFREDTNSHSYQEISPEEHFPEFYKSPNIVTWIEIYYLNDKKEYAKIQKFPSSSRISNFRITGD